MFEYLNTLLAENVNEKAIEAGLQKQGITYLTEEQSEQLAEAINKVAEKEIRSRTLSGPMAVFRKSVTGEPLWKDAQRGGTTHQLAWLVNQPE